ncbi:type II toxin-antitoxin system VapC family toxin [Jannaschia sp. LMIT008]|uniref:type II toxin-antitoxin system VapC family toxin n=1 Tax=Jannaschia maritima TaxID=3032585 RepID=UPI002811B40C|nr:type II toxin-antitoxin system VapC family toxin [Jannaschia sp. LMIT008]
MNDLGRSDDPALLLDTHAFAWLAAAPDLLGERARDAIERAGSIAYSTASLYEIGFKVHRGRWDSMRPVLPTLPERARRSGIGQVEVSAEILSEAARLDWDHGDPFDRILSATATLRGEILVTRDRSLHESPFVATIW